MDRRSFLKTTVVAGTAALAGNDLYAADRGQDGPVVGILVDTTRCIGCRACETACGEQNDTRVPDVLNDGALEQARVTDRGAVYVKRQCMHCHQAACASACPTEAMYKTLTGPVLWDGDKCLGCRYCMTSCPFDMPKFEYNDWNPRLQKCTMCFDRLAEGRKPSCVEACPTDALMFGTRAENLEIARHRIYSHPDKYVHHIYGEHEVGGTGHIYLSAVPFDQIGFRADLGNTPYPEYTREFLYAVPAILFGVPAFLLALSVLTEPDSEGEAASPGFSPQEKEADHG